ncbi:FecR family protein [Negadavirga shengliensis]|uniref:FecR family protein n=1 Tax=Negadavirga shengliensis TaxID=1389218 RepID=A0ABV9T0J4_9BACT
MAWEDQERLREIFIKYLDNQCTPAEMAELMEYFREEDNPEKLQEIIRQQMGQPVNKAFEDSPKGKALFDHAFMEIQNKIWSEQAPETKVRTIHIWKRISVAAAIVFLMGLSWIFRDTLIDWIIPVEVQYLATQTGERQQITLIDGTEVWLSPDSRLGYPEKFKGDIREVILEGEAFFDVVPDSAKPFVIRSGEVSTTVLGTSFNVEAYEESDIAVTVLTGSVSVLATDVEPIKLAPHERAVFNSTEKSLIKESAPDAEKLLAQREGIFEYEGTPLTDIVKDLNRQYKAIVKLEGDLAERSFYGMLDANQGITVFLEKLSLTLDAKWQQTGDQEYIISINPDIQ